MRIRITFKKKNEMRYTSHLDLHRSWERTFRRAELPLMYSEGFSPHPKMNIASALPLGCTGSGEILDAWMSEEVSLDAIKTSLAKASPPGLEIVDVEEIATNFPALQTEITSVEYVLTILEEQFDLIKSIEKILESDCLPRVRRGKTYDLRPLILNIQILQPDDEGCQRFQLILSAEQGSTGRPDEVLSALGIGIEKARIHRESLIFADHPD